MSWKWIVEGVYGGVGESQVSSGHNSGAVMVKVYEAMRDCLVSPGKTYLGRGRRWRWCRRSSDNYALVRWMVGWLEGEGIRCPESLAAWVGT